MKQLTLPYNLNKTGKKIGSAKTMVKHKCLSRMTKLPNINDIKNRKQLSVKKYLLKMKLSVENIQKHS